MDAEAILHEFTYAEGLPRRALKAASAQRAEMLPLFLQEIETYLALEAAARVKPTPLFFIFHLLGEWREKAAYRPLARLLRLPADEIDTMFGDGITSTSHRVMAAVFDGDPSPLCEIFLDPHAEQFIRSRMCEALAMVTQRGELDRAVAGRILRDAFMEMQPQAQNFVWFGWQSAIAMLGLSDLKTLVKKAFDRGFIDRYVLEFDHFEQDLRRSIERFGEPWRPDDHEYTLFGDAIDELSGWYCFGDQYSEDQERRRRQAEANRARGQRLENPFKGVGRNDPCPCGSGKKFKRCCLTTVRLGLITPALLYRVRPRTRSSTRAWLSRSSACGPDARCDGAIVVSALPLLVSYSADNTGLGFRAPIRAFSSLGGIPDFADRMGNGGAGGRPPFRVNHNSTTPPPR